MELLTRYLAAVDRISEGIGKAISWLCLAMILVLIYEVAARYLFNSPTAWAHESTTMLYGTFCILAGAYTHRLHGHVRSEVIYNLFPTRGKAVLDLLTGSIGLLVFGVFFWITFNYAWDSWLMREVSSKSTWAPPVYPFKAMLPLAIALMMLQSLVHVLRNVAVIFDLQSLPPQFYSAEATKETSDA
ncbi:TRAP transporter small permease subunit [Motiliproteus sp. MSK22-1]|uniref:TRAP transporter small permease subunit n=1 Tax=Motiliproteus sp. MSK22-1 TaxID=1897630 RepID=UPI000976A4BA|nr:TRAP transporter small permease subunit [Motiliproteus sp. MSK22-1]OMH26252.1 C4-dicarboxylate ABC transporter substrate-binding protein [Motiliproteus sp. MSK22-1]